MAAANVLPHDGLAVTVGGLARGDLRSELRSRGVLLNAHAETLLADAAFDDPAAPQLVTVVERTVDDLGFSSGAPLSQIFAAAEAHGLRLCPPTAGPYLRLAMTEQASAPDSVLSVGRAPSGSLTVASRPVHDDDEFPKGFYLRVMDGQMWLRGYRCDDEHLWSPADRFAFQAPSSSSSPTPATTSPETLSPDAPAPVSTWSAPPRAAPS
jgi:hypothetical protein